MNYYVFIKKVFMKRKEIYKVINEEVSEFDFLGNDDVNAEAEFNKVLHSKEFQTNFIKDIIDNISDKNKFNNISTTFINKDTDMYTDVEKIELEIEITYLYNEKEYDLILFIDGVKDEKINLDDFNLKLFSKAGDQIKMDWIEKNKELYKRFIKSLISPFLD